MHEPILTPNARRIFDLRYSRKDDDGSPTESPREVFHRVAINVAAPNALYVTDGDPEDEEMPPLEWGEDEHPIVSAKRHADFLGIEDFGARMRQGWFASELQAHRYEEMLGDLLFLPNSPTFTGAGTPLGQLSACFVLPIEDSLVQGESSIFSTLREAAAIQQTGGGNGFSFSRLRPANDTVYRSMGKASGPIGFMRGYSHAFKTIAQGGSRRGANMAVLRVDHPDIFDFLDAKIEEGEIDQFNISIAATDIFMDAVEKDQIFDLVFENRGYGLVQASDIFDRLTESAWKLGDPGCLFIDRANRDNPCPAHYEYEATNPCGEQFLPPHGSCNLGSITVQRFVRKPWTFDEEIHHVGVFDWESFRKTVCLSTEFLDDVIDANLYVDVVPRLEEMAENERRIGLGLMGVADACALMGLRYGSTEGRDFVAQVTEFARYHAMLTSIARAADRGPFPWIERSIYDPELMKSGPGTTRLVDSYRDVDAVSLRTWSPPIPMEEYTFDFGRPVVSWDAVVEGIERFGIRNATTFTFAPTGTISNVSNCEGSGCEPFFAIVFERKVMQDGEDIVLHYASSLFEQALERYGIPESDRQAIFAQVAANGGSCQGLDSVPEVIQHIFVTAADVTPEDHVRTQACIQPFVDNSISKTINLPNEATVEDVASIYKLAYELGCKGITVYRQGSRVLEVLSVTGSGGTKTVSVWPEIDPIAIPDYADEVGLSARVYPVDTYFGKVQVTITELDSHPGRPFDVRLQIGKGGSDKNADVEAIGRSISIALRGGLKVEHIVSQLEHIGGSNHHGFGEKKVRSVADGVAKLLRRVYQAEDRVVSETPLSSTVMSVDTAQTCPLCGQATIVVEAGCSHCEVRLGGCGEFERCG